jgi:hypothetical protein
MNEAIRMHMEVQRRIHEQLEVINQACKLECNFSGALKSSFKSTYQGSLLNFTLSHYHVGHD